VHVHNIPYEYSELELAVLRKYSQPTTVFSLMIFDGCILYCGMMMEASGIEAWEDAGVLLADTIYSD